MVSLTDELFAFAGDHDAGGKIRLPVPSHIRSSAVFSDCRQYRYVLHRRWQYDQPSRSVLFLLMNPSTATEDVDDPTVRKCRLYTEQWGYNHLIITNIMAYRATHPKLLLDVADPVGPDNMRRVACLITMQRPFVVCGWGRIPPKLRYAEAQAMQMLRDCQPHVLRLSKSQRPWHPLYLPNDSVPFAWNIP